MPPETRVDPLEMVGEAGGPLDPNVREVAGRLRLTERTVAVLSRARGNKPVASLREAIDGVVALMKNRQGFRQHEWEYMFQEAASTSDFPILFGVTLERELIGRYSVAQPDWRAYIATGEQRDFRSKDIVGIFGLQAPLPTKNEQGEYVEDKKLSEGKVGITLAEYGRRFGMGWRTLLQDDLGAFDDLPDRLATAALARELLEATGTFVASTGPHTGLYGAALTHPLDGATIANKGTRKLTVDNLGLACQDMLSQVDKDGNPVVVDGFELVVPPALAAKSYEVTQSAVIVLGGDTAFGVRGAVNPSKAFSITPHVNQWLPVIDVSANKATTWYLFARLASGKAAQMNFLRGRATPEVVLKAPDKVSLAGGAISALEGDFAGDNVHWRVRHILGTARIDPRMTRAEDGTV